MRPPTRTAELQDEHRRKFWKHHDEDGYECPLCGATPDTFEVHHRDGRPKNGDLDNLVALCHQCHRRIHRQAKIADRLEDMRAAVEELRGGADA